MPELKDLLEYRSLEFGVSYDKNGPPVYGKSKFFYSPHAAVFRTDAHYGLL